MYSFSMVFICLFLGWLYPWSVQEIIADSDYAKAVLGSLHQFKFLDMWMDMHIEYCDDDFFLLGMLKNFVTSFIYFWIFWINAFISIIFHPWDFIVHPFCSIGTFIYGINSITVHAINIFIPLFSWIMDLFNDHISSPHCVEMRSYSVPFGFQILENFKALF